MALQSGYLNHRLFITITRDLFLLRFQVWPDRALLFETCFEDRTRGKKGMQFKSRPCWGQSRALHGRGCGSREVVRSLAQPCTGALS